MPVNTVSKRILRPSFEAVYNCQERLRKKLDELIEENRPVSNENERQELMNLTAHALLGLGNKVDHRVEWYTVVPDIPAAGGVDFLHDLEYHLRLTLYYDKDIIPKGNYKNLFCDIPISVIWRIMRNWCFKIFPISLDRAMSISKEAEESGKSAGYKVLND